MCLGRVMLVITNHAHDPICSGGGAGVLDTWVFGVEVRVYSIRGFLFWFIFGSCFQLL